MANPKHLAILKQGVEAWNRWRRPDEYEPLHADLQNAQLQYAKLADVDLQSADLTGADLTGADLSAAVFQAAILPGANLIGACLSGAALANADLEDADLEKADLSGAQMCDAYLRRANLTRANLSRADLDGADLRETHFERTNLRGTVFSGTHLERTIFADVDLSEAKGLETCHHDGPSTIGVDTVYASGGKIPPKFLRGVGVPDTFIHYVRSLVVTPIQFYSCFISYSTKDQDFADRLYADLQTNGVRCWFAPHDIRGGKKIHEQIDDAIRVYDRLLLILSNASMNSEWVKTEIANARQREIREKRQMLFPISLVPYDRIKEWKAFDADTGKDSAREIREYFIPDFSNWKDHDSYQAAFQRLLRDLKSDGTKPNAL